MKRLYSCTSTSIKRHEINYSIKECKPTLFKAYYGQKITFKDLLFNVYWYLITQGKYRVWCAYDANLVIHTSYVIPKCSKFPFLKDNQYEIGPCHTQKQYRGKGIYPAVLYKIAIKYPSFMIIDDVNLPSIKGVIKAGFTVMPGEVKENKLKRFIYISGE